MRPPSMEVYARLCGWTLALGIVGALIGNWLAVLFGVRFTGGIDWIRHALQIAAAAVLIAIVAPMWMRSRAPAEASDRSARPAGPTVRPR